MSANATALAMETLHDLSVASNNAASYIVAEQYLEAFAVVRTATSQAHAPTPLVIECQAMDAGKNDLHNVMVEPLPNAEVFSVVENAGGCIFSCPFLLTRNHLDKDTMAKKVSLRYMKTLSAVAIFNMALACHLQHCIADKCHKAEALARRAQSLYTQAATLLEESKIQPDESATPIYLAICANLVQLSLFEGRLDGVQTWKDKFDTTIAKVSTSQSKSWLLCYFLHLQDLYIGTFAAARVA